MAFSFLEVSSPVEGATVPVGSVYCGVKASTTAAAPAPLYIYVDGVQYAAAATYLAPLYTYCWVYYTVPDGVLSAGPHSFYAVAGANTSSTFNFTMAGPPGEAVDPVPADAAATSLPLTQVSWTDGDPAADTFDVYLGPTGNVTLWSSAQASASWAITGITLAYGTTYQWRIDSTNAQGTTTGTTWSFTPTFAPPADGGPMCGPTTKRLIVCANDKFWYEDV